MSYDASIMYPEEDFLVVILASCFVFYGYR